jgi:S-adenosyl-L-methionine hydrolase (adenosine-forming)
MAAPFISFLSDYGLRDEFVGVCHAVIAGICPQARVVDLGHGVLRHDVRSGAIMLADALEFMPVGVHLAVVDPGVGGPRRAVALALADGRTLVGPDNGLLWPAAHLVGGVTEAVDIGRSAFALEPISATFHGRDIFAPVAAALAAQEPLADMGEPLAVDELRRLELPRAHAREDGLLAHVLRTDHFGNLILDASHALLSSAGVRLGDRVLVRIGGREHPGRYASTFADVAAGELLLYEDAQRMAALAVNRGSAAEQLGAGRDDEILLRSL